MLFNIVKLFQAKSQSEKNFFFKVLATLVKKLEKQLAMTRLSVVFVPFIREAAPSSFVDFVGYIFLMADQNISGELAFSCRRSR